MRVARRAPEYAPMRNGESGRPAEHVNEIVFQGEIFRMGRWRLPASHPLFVNSGPINGYCFVFPRTSLWVRHAGGRDFVADPSVALFYNDGQEYSRRAISPQGDSCDYVDVDLGALRQAIGAYDPAGADHPTHVFRHARCASDRVSDWRHRVVDRYTRTVADADPLLVEEMLVGILDRLLRLAYTLPCATPPPAGEDVVEQVRGILGANLGRGITLSQLARVTGNSPFRLCRLFRRSTRTTIHGYLSELRLRTALRRLADPRIDLSALALDLGYSTHSHFTNAFRRQYGVVPSAVRGLSARGCAELMLCMQNHKTTKRQSDKTTAPPILPSVGGHSGGADTDARHLLRSNHPRNSFLRRHDAEPHLGLSGRRGRRAGTHLSG
jgi:AraC-like DNA-binding protein